MVSTIRDALLPVAAAASRRAATGNPRRVLILQPDHLGDIILSEPAVRYLRRQLPDHELIGVVGPWSEEIARLAWPVDRVVTVAFPGFERASQSGSPLAPYTRLRQAARQLAALDATHALVLRDDAWWAAWLARLSTSELVIAADDTRTRRFASVTVPLATHRTRQAHGIGRALVERIAASEGRGVSVEPWDMSPAIALPAVARTSAGKLRAEHEIHPPYLVVHPGAGAEVKAWPQRYWRSVLERLDPRCIVVTGGEHERAECRWLAGELAHVTSIAGDTSLSALAGLLHGASLVVGTDNGPLHLAAALGTPTVRLFGPSSAERYGPPLGDSRHIVLTAGWSCLRCGDLSSSRPAGCGCMTAITPEEVLAAIETVLSDAA